MTSLRAVVQLGSTQIGNLEVGQLLGCPYLGQKDEMQRPCAFPDVGKTNPGGQRHVYNGDSRIDRYFWVRLQLYKYMDVTTDIRGYARFNLCRAKCSDRE